MKNMTPEQRWSRIQALCEEAEKQPAADRAAFLERVESNPGIRDEVQAMLTALAQEARAAADYQPPPPDSSPQAPAAVYAAAIDRDGVTPGQQPYLVMDRVLNGLPIDVYCDQQKLDIAARLRLLLQACDAVAAARRSLIVHLDLKPSSLLVDRDGRARLLDFGTAKLVRPGDLTSTRQMTPLYASPEQLRGERSPPPATSTAPASGPAPPAKPKAAA